MNSAGRDQIVNNSFNKNSVLREVLLDCVPQLRCYASVLLDTNGVIKPDDLVELCLLEMKSWTASPYACSPEELRIQVFKVLHSLCATRLRGRVGSSNGHVEPTEGRGRRPINGKTNGISEVLRALPSDQRSVLLLVSIVGFSYSEASAVLDIPVSILRTRLTKAREALYQARHRETGQKSKNLLPGGPVDG